MNWQGALNERVLTGKRITVGFDGFVDTIIKPLRHAAAAGTPAVPFGTIREFGEFLIGKAEKSCSIELEPVARRLGGNLPYLSCAAGRLGADVSCLGMLGQPGRPDPVFAKMPCKLYPFAPPGQSTCLEFGDLDHAFQTPGLLVDNPGVVRRRRRQGRGASHKSRSVGVDELERTFLRSRAVGTHAGSGAQLSAGPGTVCLFRPL